MLTLLALFSLLVGTTGFLGAHFLIFSPFFGALVTAGALTFLGLLFFAALALFLKAGNTSWVALFLGLLFYGAAGAGGYFFFLNPLNDVTTDVRNPPKFLSPVFPFRVEKGAENLDKSLILNREYDPAQAAVQLITYPAFEGMTVKAAPKDVYTEALRQIELQLPYWKKVLDDSKQTHAEFETAWSPYRFVDDIVLEVRPVPGHEFDSRIELRSRSRWPLKTDFGMNILRLRELKVRLDLVMRTLEERMAAERAAWEKENAEENAHPPPAAPENKEAAKAETKIDAKGDIKSNGKTLSATAAATTTATSTAAPLEKGALPSKAAPEKPGDAKAPTAPPPMPGDSKK